MTGETVKPKKKGGKYPNPNAGRLLTVHDEDRRTVATLSGYGVPQEQIAKMVCGGICVESLKKHFADEIMIGRAKTSVGMGKALYNKAMGGDTPAMIWWTKAMMKWTDPSREDKVTIDMKAETTTTVDVVAVANTLKDVFNDEY